MSYQTYGSEDCTFDTTPHPATSRSLIVMPAGIEHQFTATCDAHYETEMKWWASGGWNLIIPLWIETYWFIGPYAELRQVSANV